MPLCIPLSAIGTSLLLHIDRHAFVYVECYHCFAVIIVPLIFCRHVVGAGIINGPCFYMCNVIELKL